MNWKIPDPETVLEVSAADGYALTVRRYGNPNGTRIVLTHGNGFAIDAYFPFWSRLTERFDCFVFDLRNHGWNSVNDDPLRHSIPFFLDDGKRVVREIELRFGPKPTVGIFHSLSTITALHHASARDCFAALILFDPPLFPPGGLPVELRGFVAQLGEMTRNRPRRFESVEAFAVSLRKNPAYRRLSREALTLFARSTLRRVPDEEGYGLRCPPDFEAQIFEHMFSWGMTADFSGIRCPIKAIGSDPTVPYSFMPSMDLAVLIDIDYDFVPETSHFLQLEEPETCAKLAVVFLEERGFA